MPGSEPLLVFVAGLGGFDRIRLGGRSIAYFRGLEAALQRRGIPASFPPQKPFGCVAERAELLARHLAGLAQDRLTLVAHSMGGLDCRYFVHHLDRDRRVGTVVTVATPHRGTPLADWLLQARAPIPWLGRSFMRAALHDLSTAACECFNLAVPDRPDVRYLSYAGVRAGEETARILRPWVRRIAAAAGDNDSQVPLSSAIWGTFKGVVRADHTELAGWSVGARSERFQRPFDHLVFYARLLDDLASDVSGRGVEYARAGGPAAPA